MRKVLFLAVLLLSVIGVFAQNTSKNCYRGYVDAGYSVGVGDYDDFGDDSAVSVPRVAV